MKKSDCIFCKIISGEIPSCKIHEDDEFLAILDIAQFTEGHTIVIPKEHFDTMWDVPNIGEYLAFVQKVGNHFRGLEYKYVDTLTFGRMVLHSHVHIVPHNGDSDDWEKALQVIGEYQQDPSRHPNNDKGKKLIKKFSF